MINLQTKNYTEN